MGSRDQTDVDPWVRPESRGEGFPLEGALGLAYRAGTLGLPVACMGDRVTLLLLDEPGLVGGRWLQIVAMASTRAPGASPGGGGHLRPF